MQPTNRPAPSFPIALAIGLLYGPILPLLLVLFGVNYQHITQSLHNIQIGVVLPMLLLTITLASIISRFGWWQTILWESKTAPRWLLVMPMLILACIASVIDFQRIAQHETAFLFWAAIGTLGVGFCEESVYRGITLVGLRERLPEWGAWLLSSLLFALIHAWNYFAGQGLDATVNQLVNTFMFGSFLYVCRRASGTILLPMLLHALWDWSLFVSAAEGHTAKDSGNFTTYCVVAMLLVFVIGAKPLFSKQANQA